MGKFEIPPELANKMQQRSNVAAIYRGLLLNKFAELEFIIEMIISRYFCDNVEKENEFRHALICTKYVTFDAKTTVLGFIIKHHFPEFEKSHPKLGKDLENYRDLRNIVAHRKLLHSQERVENFNGDDISLENFETDAKRIKLKDEQLNKVLVNQWELRMGNTIFALDELLTSLTKGETEKEKNPL